MGGAITQLNHTATHDKETVYFRPQEPVYFTRKPNESLANNVEDFAQSPDMALCISQLLFTIDAIKSIFASGRGSTHSGKPLDSSTFQNTHIKLNHFRNTIQNLNNPNQRTAISINTLLGHGKKALEHLHEQLKNPEISHETKQTAIANLSDALDACSEGIYIAIVKASQILNANGKQLSIEFQKIFDEVIEQSVLQVVQNTYDGVQDYDITEVHYVNSIKNILAPNYGLTHVEDAYRIHIKPDVIRASIDCIENNLQNCIPTIVLTKNLIERLKKDLEEIGVSTNNSVSLENLTNLTNAIEQKLAEMQNELGLSNVTIEDVIWSEDGEHFEITSFNPKLHGKIVEILLQNKTQHVKLPNAISIIDSKPHGISRKKIELIDNMLVVSSRPIHAHQGITYIPAEHIHLQHILKVCLPKHEKAFLAYQYLKQKINVTDEFKKAVKILQNTENQFNTTNKKSFATYLSALIQKNEQSTTNMIAKEIAILSGNEKNMAIFKHFNAYLTKNHIKNHLLQSIQNGAFLNLLDCLKKIDPEGLNSLICQVLNGKNLHNAIVNNQHEMVELMLQAGFSAEIRCKDNRTPLMNAFYYGNMKTINVLIKYDANPLLAYKKDKPVEYYLHLTQNQRNLKTEFFNNMMQAVIDSPKLIEGALLAARQTKNVKHEAQILGTIAKYAFENNCASIKVENQHQTPFMLANKAIELDNSCIDALYVKVNEYLITELLDLAMLTLRVIRQKIDCIRPNLNGHHKTDFLNFEFYFQTAKCAIWKNNGKALTLKQLNAIGIDGSKHKQFRRFSILLYLIELVPNSSRFHIAFINAINEHQQIGPDHEFIKEALTIALNEHQQISSPKVWLGYAKVIPQEGIKLNEDFMINSEFCTQKASSLELNLMHQSASNDTFSATI